VFRGFHGGIPGQQHRLLSRRFEVIAARRIEHIIESYGNVARAERQYSRKASRSLGVMEDYGRADPLPSRIWTTISLLSMSPTSIVPARLDGCRSHREGSK